MIACLAFPYVEDTGHWSKTLIFAKIYIDWCQDPSYSIDRIWRWILAVQQKILSGTIREPLYQSFYGKKMKMEIESR